MKRRRKTSAAQTLFALVALIALAPTSATPAQDVPFAAPEEAKKGAGLKAAGQKPRRKPSTCKQFLYPDLGVVDEAKAKKVRKLPAGFPLPPDATYCGWSGFDTFLFMSAMGRDEVLKFYRDALEGQGYMLDTPIPGVRPRKGQVMFLRPKEAWGHVGVYDSREGFWIQYLPDKRVEPAKGK